MKLVIVESPAKAKTIGKYLGEDYKVDASGGHIRDLPTKKMGVDIKNNYRPEYEVSPTKKDTIARLKEEVKKADEVFLATDPDREGEAISWHLQTVLKLKANQKNRITFNEISKKAVQKAILNPGYIDMNLVNAQQARRVLDRLVGYTLSPVLCKKIQGKLSAGRVQSSALKIMVDREREIKAFVPKEFWNITALVEKPKFEPSFKILLTEKDGKKWVVGNKQQSEEALSAIEGKEYIVDNVKLSVTRSNPLPPFTTSTMQQDGVNKLRMTSAVVMSTAQQLYEGVEIKGMGHVALVTYIRTDSVRISDDASREARELITNRYGAKYVPATPNKYFSKKGAQDAHEAIRPINLSLSPDSIKGLVDTKQYNLYKLIYERFLASQCVSAEYNSVAIKVKCGQYGFKANGRTVLFDGYTAIYGEGKSDEDDNEKLPKLIEGDKLNLLKLDSEQKFTKPVSRYTES
ncbi:MAG: type I DNA topoisomerase, partial [Clostridia bacterium]